jgi:hypothetical protein
MNIEEQQSFGQSFLEIPSSLRGSVTKDIEYPLPWPVTIAGDIFL